MGAARAQELPTVVSPLRVEPDVNGVNVSTGRIQIEGPVLSVPAAPNLRFDRIQNAAPYVKGQAQGTGDDAALVAYSVHTGTGSSESFRCDGGECTSVTGSGSTYGGSTYQQAGSGTLWNFTRKSHDTLRTTTNGTSLYYASSVVFTNGERLSYTYHTEVSGTQTFYRPTRIDSSLGYYLTFTYQGDTFGTVQWNAVATASLYRRGAPDVLLGRLTYSGSTVTDLNGRVYSCVGCSNSLGSDLEATSGSLTLPGEATPTLQVTQLSDTQRVVGTVTRDGVQWTYSYTNLQQDPTNFNNFWFDTLTVTGPEGYRQVYAFVSMERRNVLDRVTQNVTATTTRTIDYQLDAAGRPTQMVAPEGNRIDVVYDGQGNITTRTTTPKANSGQAAVTETVNYTDPTLPSACDVFCWRPNWSRDALNRQTDYAYNTKGQLTERTDPADAAGVRRRTINEYTSVTPSWTADAISRRTATRICGTGAACGTAAEIRTEYGYDADNYTLLPNEQRQVAGTTILTTRTVYNDEGRPVSVDGPLPGDGDATYYRYDVHGRRTWEIGPAAHNGYRVVQRHYYRDADDLVYRTETGYLTDPQAATFTEYRQTDYGYDARRNRVHEAVSFVNSSGTTVYLSTAQRTFDDRNRVECEARRMNSSQLRPTSLPASACALDTQGSFGPDRITRFIYDDAGQLLQEQRAYTITTANGFPETLQQNYATYTYSLNGKRTSVTDANNNRTDMTYDGFDRLRRWTFPAAGANPSTYEEYGYDAVGNRTSLRKRDGSTLTYSFDNLNRTTAKLVPERTGLDATHTRDVYYGYDVGDRQTYARFDSATGPGITNSYDGFGRMLTSTNNMNGTRRLSYAWDAGSRRTQVTYPSGLDFGYDYDGAGNLTGIRDVDAAEQLFTFSYDGIHRIDLRTDVGAGGVNYGFDRADRLNSLAHTFTGGTGNVSYTFSYNPASQVESRTRSNDAYAWDGAVNVDRPYSVNGLNQYTSAGATSFSYDRNGNLTASGSTTYTYDVENRLVAARGGQTIDLRYDPLGRLYETVGASGTRRLIWDGDALVAEYTETGALAASYVHGTASGDDPLLWRGGGENRRIHADHQGSVIAITNDAGTPIYTNSYDEWGIPGSANGGRFQYTGQIWLADLGMYHYKARIYSPTLGRFLQVDPVGYEGGINLYGYVGNDPLNNTDPDGRNPLAAGAACMINSVCRGALAAGAAAVGGLLFRPPAPPTTAGPRSSSTSSSTQAGEGRSRPSAAPVAERSRDQTYTVRVQAQGTGLRQEQSEVIEQNRPVTAGQVEAAIANVTERLTGREQRIIEPAADRARVFARAAAEGRGVPAGTSRSFGNDQHSRSVFRIDIDVFRGERNIVED
ncbi:MAG: hypothetical protein M3177_02855 [Pseudomonadota bacterium]|nr:hypothetical protein [Pseudomonadota bacterium]